jgi:hypothetical protein
VTEEEKRYTVDLRPFMSPSPYTVQHVSAVQLVCVILLFLCHLNSLSPGKGQVVSVLHWISTMPQRHSGEMRYSFTIIDLCTRWKWVASLVHWQLYPEGKIPWYLLYRRLDEQLWMLWRSEKYPTPAGNWVPAVQLVAHHYWLSSSAPPHYVNAIYWAHKVSRKR